MKVKFIIFLFLLFVHCQKESTPVLSSDDLTFVNIYIEILKLNEQMSPQHPAYLDSSRSIIRKYNFSWNEYQKTLKKFHEKPERWEAFYKQVLEQLKEKSPPISSP
jgi:hypothetical protein